jgi:hypothetical protein
MIAPTPKRERPRDAALAKGGTPRTLPKQAATPQKPGTTAAKGDASGSKRAVGGPPLRGGASRSVPATPGRTSAVRKGDAR